MALKNWQKISISTPLNSRWRKHSINGTLQKGIVDVYKRDKNKWIVDRFPIGTKKRPLIQKSFRSRDKAVAFATSYMKTH